LTRQNDLRYNFNRRELASLLLELWRESVNREDVFNFSAGPSVMPEDALKSAEIELMNYKGCGISVMEMSHRSSMFQDIFDETKNRLKNILHIPDTHEILFLQGGGTTQFAAVPMNLMKKDGCADYALTGHFSKLAYEEAAKYGTVHVSCSSEDSKFSYIPDQSHLETAENSSYFYYCSNNTIYGTEWHYVPDAGNVPLVSDMSSDILSQDIDFKKYNLIFAGAQKNMAPAGLTVVIVRKEATGNELAITPKVMSYAVQIKKDSMLNTPPCWCIYMLNETLKWVQDSGGIPAMEELKAIRSSILYDVIDNSTFYSGYADPASRSYMNVTFHTPSEELDLQFVKEAQECGLLNLKGHRTLGGLRASIYNAMPVEGAQKLAEFMKKFEVSYK